MMSLHLPSRRALGLAPTILRLLRPSVTLLPITQQQQQRRTYKSYGELFGSKGKKSSSSSSSGGPSSKDLKNSVFGDISSANTRRSIRERMRSGRVEGDSIFAEELQKTSSPKADEDAATAARRSRRDPGSTNDLGASVIKEHMARAVDPDPRSRVRWERKVVMRHVGRCLSPFGRETRVERVKRTEREYTEKSPYLGTSTKKLVHLARQIQGKTLADAIVQMRFSKKRAAKDVKFTLEDAAARAVVERGMGLGKATGEVLAEEGEVKIRTKDGKWIVIDDPTRIYVAEAWVGRGKWRGMRIEYKGRGHRGLMKRPTASISVVLKEEKTRIREHNERKAKEERQGPWVHLPDRPVTSQRPFYSW